jgi:hypothetical protein
MGIQQELSKLENEIAELQATRPAGFQKRLGEIDTELSVLEKVIDDEEHDWDGTDSDDNGGAGDDDDGDDDDGDDVPNPGRRRLYSTRDQGDLGKAYSQVDSDGSGSPLATRHRFQALTDFVANRDGVDKATAATTTRKEYPEAYRSFQNWRGVAKSYDALVQAEVDRGFSPLIAKQRILHSHGAPPFGLQKRSPDVADFIQITSDIRKRHPNLTDQEVFRKARLQNPEAFNRYQNV